MSILSQLLQWYMQIFLQLLFSVVSNILVSIKVIHVRITRMTMVDTVVSICCISPQIHVRQLGGFQGDAKLQWPDSAVSAATALEKACNEALGSDFQKYNQKMRQLCFNLKVELSFKVN